ncbi:MAG: hypothetical protein A2161_12450 [Candidatus Schekmanbacteria bacterium RBG_13_48_7]|uniref:aspartate kinase n=1 Tax=Candidatus Schekmanbacteria bacterium RBG_13_48_7 TaxID=1817878 RepID=A0A1F7RMD4_9BACT|nr:MAG: hypothetical protein A2161_12450 [Candidatus Schekmanbacteria bacterium RBG_13_48_7]
MVITASDVPMSYGFLVELFHIFNRYRVSVNSVASTVNSVSMTIKPCPEYESTLFQELERLGKISIKQGRAIVSVIGEGVKRETRLAKSMSAFLENKKVKVDIVSQNSHGINLSFIIDNNDVETAVKHLHKELFRTIHDYVPCSLQKNDSI